MSLLVRARCYFWRALEACCRQCQSYQFGSNTVTNGSALTQTTLQELDEEIENDTEEEEANPTNKNECKHTEEQLQENEHIEELARDILKNNQQPNKQKQMNKTEKIMQQTMN